MKIIYWNVNRSDLSGHVCNIAAATNAELIVLNENLVESEITLSALRLNVSEDFYVPGASQKGRFHCFSRRPSLGMAEVHAGFRTSVRKTTISNQLALIVLVHGVDIRNYDPETRQSFAQSLASEMQFIKEIHNTNRLILIGDFNMNPYDRGMNLAPGLNAMMTMKCASSGTRRHLGQNYDLYYNPMWNLFGDRTPGPAGTTYDTSNQGPYGWNMLDQVILSHSLVDHFENVEILTKAGAHDLIDRHGHPDSRLASDHLPVLLTLREQNND